MRCFFPRWRRREKPTRFSAGCLSAPRPDRRAERLRRAVPAAWPRRPPRPASAAIAAGGRCTLARRSARQILLLNAPSAVQFGKPDRILQLVVVDGMRQRHQHRRPPHHRKLGHGRGAGAADHQVRLGHLLGQVGEERGKMRAHAGRLIGLLDARPGPPRGTAARRTGWRGSPRAAAPAPAAARRRRSARPGCRRTPAASRARSGPACDSSASPSRPPGRARDCRSGAPASARRPLQVLGVLERGGDRRDAARQHAGWRGRARRSARAGRSECRAGWPPAIGGKAG